MWIILLSIVIALVLTYLGSKFFSNNKDSKEDTLTIDSDCCGAHAVCEKETLLSATDHIIYFQDEELDQYIGRSPESYSAKEIEEFREILYTMRDDEVAGWLRSLHLRNINPPLVIREEALMIVAEIRDIIRTDK